jgi:hypothetical protein
MEWNEIREYCLNEGFAPIEVESIVATLHAEVDDRMRSIAVLLTDGSRIGEQGSTNIHIYGLDHYLGVTLTANNAVVLQPRMGVLPGSDSPVGLAIALLNRALLYSRKVRELEIGGKL